MHMGSMHLLLNWFNIILLLILVAYVKLNGLCAKNLNHGC
jgi:hypothetical protein